MSFSFSSLIRLLVLLALGTTMLAIGLSRLNPPWPSLRTRSALRYSNVNEHFLNGPDRTPHWLDAQTGQIFPESPDDGGILEIASSSPWIDEKGRTQVVGRWSSRTPGSLKSVSSDFGLARYTFPRGEMIDHITTEVVPVSPPCWYPGTSARVLFAAGDGMLYHYAFEPDHWQQEGIDPAVRPEAGPRRLLWQCPTPGEGKIFISDLNWSTDPRMTGCLVVALREQVSSPDGNRSFSQTQLWWLKLNFAGTEVVKCGRLLSYDKAGSSSRAIDIRTPTIGTLADGRLALAYLTRREGDNPGWELRAAPILFDSDHQTPRANELASVLIYPRCHPCQPTFSPDGKWLNFLTSEDMKMGRVGRISTKGFFKDAG